jgi:hypothetical protein
MTLVAFELSMPGVASWNGHWSGEERLHVCVVNLGRNADAAQKIIEGSPYFYSFGGGWAASVSARLVDATGARRLRRQSAGFAGYDWMIEEIRSHGRILPLAERVTS